MSALVVIVLGGWIFLKILEWVLSWASPGNPHLDDEDEIDHRFY
jgi:hypothetical protein